MIAYTDYSTDTRVRREAETLARHENIVRVISLAEGKDGPSTYELRGVTVMEQKVKKYLGKNVPRYFISYIKFFLYAAHTCTKLFMKGQTDIVHVHHMPDFMVFAGIIPRLFSKKLILDIHDSMPETYASKFKELTMIFFRFLHLEELLCCKVAHQVICVTHTQRKTF